jgi:hypothetical protein
MVSFLIPEHGSDHNQSYSKEKNSEFLAEEHCNGTIIYWEFPSTFTKVPIGGK